MLVLTRKVGEKIMIGDNISIQVVDVRKGTVRLGIEAPQDVALLRAELSPDPKRRPAAKQAHDAAAGDRLRG